MTGFPYIEEISQHDSGDLSTVADWLVDCLDRRLPRAGTHLTLYLCYHPNDFSYFDFEGRNEALALEMQKACVREAQWDDQSFGEMRFGLTVVRSPPVRMLLHRRGAQAEGSAPSIIEFSWQETDSQVAPGNLAVVRVEKEPLTEDSLLVAQLEMEGEIKIALHIERWQRNIRWQKEIVYLPEGISVITLGEGIGCDLCSPSIFTPYAVTYDSASDEWTTSESVVNKKIYRDEQGACVIRFVDKTEQVLAGFRGRRLESPRPLKIVAEENYLPQFELQIVGCLLPLPQPDGYGIIPAGLPLSIRAEVASGVQLPGKGVLFLDKQNEPSWLPSGSHLPPHKLADNPTVHLEEGIPRSKRGIWIERTARQPVGFRGELLFEPPFVVDLSRGRIEESLPDSLFPDYKDCLLGRAPIRLQSEDGHKYALRFNQNAKLPVSLLNSCVEHERLFYPDEATGIKLGGGADFICGSTHFRLRKKSETEPAKTLF